MLRGRGDRRGLQRVFRGSRVFRVAWSNAGGQAQPSSVKTPSADFLDPPARTLRWVTAGVPRFERPRLRLADFSLTPTSSTQTNWGRLYELPCAGTKRRSLRSGAYADSRFVGRPSLLGHVITSRASRWGGS